MTIGEQLSLMMRQDSSFGDDEMASQAQFLDDVRWKMQQLANTEGDKFKPDEFLRGEAMAIGETMVKDVDGDDVYGVRWSPDQKGYKTGAEYKAAMLKLWNTPDEFIDHSFDDFRKLDRAGKLAEALKDVSPVKKAMHAVGGFVQDMVAEGVGTGANMGSGSVWAGGAGDASRVKPVSDEEKAARQKAWEDGIIRRHEAKLSKRNAWIELSSISSYLQGDAKTVVDALLASKDNAVPTELYATFNRLSDDEKTLVCRARELMKPAWDGESAATIAHDMAAGLVNLAERLRTAPAEQLVKVSAIAANGLFDAGIDVNKLARDRQYLWQATGRMFADGAGGGEPLGMFEQRCEDHGIVGDVLIGTVTTLPYMAAAAVPYAGPAMVAMEAMSEMDEHVIMEGGDISDPRYLVTSAVLGGVYAYIERLQLGKFLGETNELALRGALQRGMVNYLKKHPVRAAWNLTAETLSESVQEGLQQGVMGVNEALALGKSVPAAFAEGFIEDFVGSLGTMFVIGAGGHVVGHAARSGWKMGEAGARNRTRDYTSALLQAFQENRVAMAGQERMQQFLKEVDGFLDEHYDGWKKGGRAYLESLGYSPETVDAIDGYLKEDESLADGMHPPEDRKADVQTAIVNDLKRMYNEARAANGEEWLAKDVGIKEIRDAWARGNALSEVKVDEDGKPVLDENGLFVLEDDLGAAELRKIGFTEDQAKMLSSVLAYERYQYYSRGSVEAMRAVYDRATDRQTAPAERLAASLKGGEVVRRDGLTFVRFDVEAGKDADGKPIWKKAAYVINEDASLADWKPDFANPRPNEATSIANDMKGRLTPVKDENGNFKPITAALWKEMTPAEREEFWNRNHGAARGNFEERRLFRLVNPATGSEISAQSIRDIGYFIGRINIDPKTDETAIFHENLHGLVRFCREMGILNDEDVAEFVRTFGEPKTMNELFDEEPFAMAAESFVLKRRNGSAIEDTPANRALAKIFSFGAKIAAEGEIRWAERKVAEREMHAAADQVEVTAANKVAAESRFKKVKPMGEGEKPASENAKPTSDNARPVSDNAKPVSENGKDGPENKKPTKTKAIETNDKGEVRFTALTPTGNRKVGGHYEVVPLGELMDSNQPGYPMELQARDRKDNKAEKQTREDHITNFEPGYLLSDPGTDGGAPLVVRQTIDGRPRLVVVSGNGRTMILQALAERKLYDRYRGAMKGWADANGVAVDVADDANPVLIRVIDDLGGATLKEIADLSNTNAIQQMNEDERARSDAEVIRALGIAKLYQANVDGSPDMSPGANDEFFAAFQRGVGQNDSLYNPDGTLTQAARDRAVRALVAIAVGQGPRGRETVKKLALQADTLGLNRQKNAAAAMAAAVADLERKPEYAIGADVSRAYADYMDFLEQKKAGKVGTLDEYAAQQDMLDRRSEIAEGVLMLVGGSKNAREIAEAVKTYCKAAEGEDPSGNLFGAARTREQIWRDAVAAAGGEAGPRLSVQVSRREYALIRSEAYQKLVPFLSAGKELPSQIVVNTFDKIYCLVVRDIGDFDVVGVYEITPENDTLLKKQFEEFENGLAEARKDTDQDIEAVRSDEGRGRGHRLHDAQLSGRSVGSSRLVSGLSGNRRKASGKGSGVSGTQADRKGGVGGPRLSVSATGETVYHGSAADWRAPSLDFIGSGQGAAVEGYGLNFTTDKAMADAWGRIARRARAARGGYGRGLPGFASYLFAPVFRYEAKIAKGANIVDYHGPVGPEVVENVKNALLGRGVRLTERDQKRLEGAANSSFARFQKVLFNLRAEGGAAISPVAAAATLVEAGVDGSKVDPSVDGAEKTLTLFNLEKIEDLHQFRNDTRRWSFAASDPHVVTGGDIRKAVAAFGRADGIGKALYCLPDGTLLKGKGRVFEFAGRRFESFGHDDWAEMILNSIAGPGDDASTWSGKLESVQRGIARAGAIRISGDKNGLTVSHEPTPAQYDALYDMASEAYEIMEANGDDELLIDVTDENLATLFTLAYPRGTSARRIIEDLRGWYERGENPVERERSMLAEFHRWSVAPKGVQKGAAIEYPDAADELRAMDDAASDGARFSISGLYTGSAADYEKPSLHFVGTGEGSQVYGWGLYASSERGVADRYTRATRGIGSGTILLNGEKVEAGHDSAAKRVAKRMGWIEDKGKRPTRELALADAKQELEDREEQRKENIRNEWSNKNVDEWISELKEDIALLENKKNKIEWTTNGYVYEQTFFTNRAPGDESHLLKWYEPVSEENRRRVEDALGDRFSEFELSDADDEGEGEVDESASTSFDKLTGEQFYNRLSAFLGSPQAASEFLARADIDGIKYPVDSYGGKTVKDGDKAGWNYVSFRDDNIRVDHKWVDGQRRFSIGARRRAEFRELIGRKRPDLAAEDVEAALDEIAGYETAKKQKLAVHWLITGAIELPEDAYKLDKAIATAERAKVDPFQYRNPEDIFSAFPQHLPKDPAIDPDTVPELTNKTDMGHGVTVYNVDEGLGGQKSMRRIINTHWGKDANPWCLLQADSDGNLSSEALHYWMHYNALPKKVAFHNGKLLAFMATSGDGIQYAPGALKRGEVILPDEEWWDRKDASHAGIPIEGKIKGDPLGRSGVRELKDGKLTLVGQMWRGDRKNGKYELWNGDYKTLEQEFKDGRPVGWRRTYRLGELSTSEHYNEKSEHDLPQLEFYPGVGLARYIEYGEGDHAERVANFDDDGTIRDFRENGGLSKPAKRAVGFRAKFNEISWTDDAGDYYSVIADEFGRVSSATTIDNLDSGRLWQRREIGAEELESLRTKLEGESAAILEAVKAEAAAIYREYSPAAGARFSVGRVRTRTESDRRIAWMEQLDRNARASEPIVARTIEEFPVKYGLTPIEMGIGDVWDRWYSLHRQRRTIDRAETYMEFVRQAQTRAMMAERETDEFKTVDGRFVENAGANGLIHAAIVRDLGSVDIVTARTIPGWEDYFELACLMNGNMPGLFARCFKETAGFHAELAKIRTAIDDFRILGADTGIRGRTVRPSEMGVNVSNEGRVIGATPIEDWFGDNLEGHLFLERLKKAVAKGVNVSQLNDAYRVYKHLPGVAATELERKYAKLLLAACGRVETPWIRDAAKEAATELAQELVTKEVVAKVIADIRANKAEKVQMAYRHTDNCFVSAAMAIAIRERLVKAGVNVDESFYKAKPRNAIPIDTRDFRGYIVFVDNLFSSDVGDISNTVEYAKRDVGSNGITYVSAFGTKVGNRFGIEAAELTQLLENAKIPINKLNGILGYEIQSATGPETRKILRHVYARRENLRVLLGSGVDRLFRQYGSKGSDGGSDSSDLAGTLRSGSGSWEVLHESEGLRRGVGEAALGSSLNDNTRWSIASRKLDWDALPNTLDKVIFSTSVQHFTGQDKVPEKYELFKQYRNFGHLDVIKPEVDKWAKSTGPLGWLGLYLQGKYYGDLEAARKVVRHRISNQRIGAVRSILIPEEPVQWLYVRNDDGKRTNRLPQAYAEALAERFGGSVGDGIVKVSDQRNTSAGMKTRAHREFEFAGEPAKGVQYVIVDDVWTTGQTTVSLLDYLVGKGANVRGITTLAVASHGSEIKPPKERIAAAVRKSQFATVEEANAAVGLDLRKATGSELQAYFTGARSNRFGFIDWFDPSSNEFALDFAGRGQPEPLLTPPVFSERDRRGMDLQRWRERNASQGVFDFRSGRLSVAAADSPLSAIASAKTTREVEAAARMSFSARLADGDERAAERALVNYVAYHKLTGGGVPRPTTLAKLGLALGMKTVQAKRIIEDAQRVADRAAGTVIEKAARNGDVGTAFSLMEREREREAEIRKIISGGAKAGGDLVLGGVVAQGTILGRRIEQTMRSMTAATLADIEGDTGLDLAAEILQNDPKAFDDELKALKPRRDEDTEDTVEQSEQSEQSNNSRPLTDREKWMRDEAKKEAARRVAAFVEAAKARAEENRRKAEERRAREAAARAAGEEPSEGGESGDGSAIEQSNNPNNPNNSPTVAGFTNKWEFAAFLRKWAEDKYAQTHGTTTLGRSEENRLFAEFYRICVQRELQDLADKLLDPKGARAWANRRIGELEKGLKPDTIERASADIFAFINRNAIRETRVKLIEEFRKEIRQFVKGPEFEELKVDSTRRLTGWVEEAARYMMKVCQLSGWAANGGTSAFERERQALLEIIDRRRKVYDESGKPVGKAATDDMETIRATWKLQLLERYGAMAQMMPGEIEDLKVDAIRYLTEEAAALEDLWRGTKARQDSLRQRLAAGIEGPNGQRYDSNQSFFGRLFDDLNGLIRLRLKHLTRFAGKKARADAEGAIDEIVTMLGQGEVAYAREVQKDRQEFMRALGRIFQDQEGRPNRRAIRDYLKRMEEPIPAELARQISVQGYAETMTYGQMLQLLVSLEQKSYAENVRVNGREGQAELIRRSSAFTSADALFIDWLRAFYEAKRVTISGVTERMTGMKVESPDPLYCPVKTYRKDVASDLHVDSGRWNAIDDVLSSRVRHTRDFDESATILGQFYDRSNRMAGLVAWAERGTLIQNVICSSAVEQRIRLAFGEGELGKIRRQLEDTFNGGTSRSKTPGEIEMMDKAMNFITFGYLGFNPLSAAKQTTSFTVWANVLPGGFRELWHHMTHIDREAVRHIMESDEYKVRYGDDTGSGQDLATKTLTENVGQNPFMRLMTGPGMWLLKKGDFLPGVWIMQGVYKSFLNKHLQEGMEESAADRLALTEAFNLLEETQQSGRTYNTNALAREHGRLGAALVQFATSPLQQLQYETQAFREWRDLKRYGADETRIAEARAKLIRAAFINHVLLPAAMELVIAVFRAIMGDEPRWEKDGYAWDLLRDVLLGQASRIFYVGVLASSVMDALFKRQLPRGSQLIPSEGAITIMANVAVTAHDVMTLDGEKVRKDLERMAKSLAPTRIPYNLYRRVTGDSDVDRKKAEGK